MAQNRKSIYAIGALGVALALCYGAYRLFSQETIEVVAEKSFNSILNGNGAEFKRLLSERESRAYNMTGEQWTKFFKGYVHPALIGWRQLGTPVAEYKARSEEYVVRHPFVGPNGRIAELALTVARSDEGPRTYLVPSSILGFVTHLKYVEDRSAPSELRYKYISRRMLAEESRILESMGIKGGYDPLSGGMIPWSDAMSRLDQSIARLESRLNAVAR